MKLQESKYPLLKAFAPVYEMRKRIGEFMLNQMQATRIAKEVEDFLKQLIAECNFSMCVPAESIGDIIESDCIKNAIALGKQGTTMGGNQVRIKALGNIYGLPMNSFGGDDLPTYGILTGKNTRADLVLNPDIFWHYGAIMIHFKKEHFMDRTTMTVGSSLDFMESELKTPVPVDEPNVICIKGYPTRAVAPNTRVFNGLGFFHHLITDLGLSVAKPNRMSELAEEMPGFENFELQFHGPIQFSRDVKAITVCTIKGDEMDIISKYTDKLNSMGIEVSELMEQL